MAILADQEARPHRSLQVSFHHATVDQRSGVDHRPSVQRQAVHTEASTLLTTKEKRDMAETTKPRNVDGQIVCPPGYDLKPDGLCYAKEGVIEKIEHAIAGAAETNVHEVEKVGAEI